VVPALPVLPRLGTWYFGVVGQGRGEFETWRWLHWWMHRLLEFHAREAGGLGDLAVRILFLARDLDIGNMADTLFLSFPLEALVGAPASHNLKILLILVGNALAAGVLARTLGAQGQALWVAAAGLALSPFVWTEVQECRMAEAILVFVFLGAAAWVRLQRNPTPKGGALFGSVLGLALVFYWFYGLWLAMWCLLTLVPSKRILSPLAVAAVVTAAISLPFLAPYLVGEGSRSPVPFGRSYPALEELDRLPAGQLGPLGPSLVLSQSLPPGGGRWIPARPTVSAWRGWPWPSWAPAGPPGVGGCRPSPSGC